MLTIDEIKIEAEEDGWHLVIYTDGHAPTPYRFLIGVPDQVRSEVERTIGAWLNEGEMARRSEAIERGDAPNSRNAYAELDEPWPGQTSLEDLIDSGAADMYRDLERGK